MIIIKKNSLKIYKYIYIFTFIFIIIASFFDLKHLEAPYRHNFKVMILVFQFFLFIIFILLLHESNKLFNRKAQEFDSLTQIIPGGIAKVYGNDKFTIHYADDTFYKIIGYTKEDFFNYHHNNSKFLIHPDDLNSVIRTFKFQMDNGQPFKAIFRVIRKDSQIIWIQAKGNTLLIDKDLTLYNFIFTDITSSKNALSQLDLENKRYEIICRLSDKVYFEYDILNDTLINNTVCQKLFGNDNVITNFKENPITNDVIHKDDIPVFMNLYKDFNNGIKNISYNIRIKNSNNTYNVWHIKAEPIFDNNNVPIKIIGTATDISQKQPN